MPKLDREQKRIVRLIRREGRNIADPKLRRIYERAAVQTGLVESGLHNLSGGDQDSAGWRQERSSLYANPTDLKASVRRFREEFQQHYDPGEKSYEVAAQVQRPREDLRGRYREEAGTAAQILKRAGDGGPTLTGSRSQSSYETVPGKDNSGLRQQFLQAYLTERGKPNSLLDLKAGLDSAQDTPAKRVKLSEPGGSVRTNPGASVPAGRSPTGGKGKVIGTPYSGTHTLGNWQSDNAVDISVKEGTKIRSTGTGKVVKVSGGYSGGSSRFDGYQVTIETPNGSRFYTHLKKVSVKPGQKIKRGQVLGRSGSANGVPHLHFGVEEGDPRRFT